VPDRRSGTSFPRRTDFPEIVARSTRAGRDNACNSGASDVKLTARANRYRLPVRIKDVEVQSGSGWPITLLRPGCASSILRPDTSRVPSSR